MKNTLLATLLLFVTNSYAQTWVQVPDPNFQTYLTANYPAAAFMTSGSDFFVDADNAVFQTYSSIDVQGLNISSLEGVQVFTALQTLDCRNNQLSSLPNGLSDSLLYLFCANNPLDVLPDLPTGLMALWCDNANLTSIPVLPNTLIQLLCGYNSLQSLPSLPNGLTNLICENNQLTALPALPDSLQVLVCSNNQILNLPELPSNLLNLQSRYNQLTTLPTLPPFLLDLDFVGNQIALIPDLPLTLQSLVCAENLISIIPDLPNTLLRLFCSNNTISVLPELPSSLIALSCDNNQLTFLPDLPDLEVLYCQSNQLSSLPDLPQTLINLFCEANQIQVLPDLPDSLVNFNCSINQISCFPNFPVNLEFIYLASNPFTCLPNYIPAMDAATLAFPLCEAGNPNGCQSAMGIQGSVFDDANSDCVDSGLPVIYVPMVLNDNTGTLITSSTNLVNGDYYFVTETGDYQVEINTATLNPSVQVNCPATNELTATVTQAVPVVDAGDFGLSCAGFDLGVQSVTPIGWFFPGQTHELNILAGDLSAQYNMHCATGISGEVTVSVSGPGTITFGGSPSSSTGSSATYTLADFGAIGANFFSASILTDTTALAGDEFCVSVVVTTAATGELNSSNNSYNFCYQVMNSYDPNIKLTTPELVDPGYSDEFTYTIYFQNTGNAPAFNIRLADTLDANLDWSTLKFVNASHNFTTSLSAESGLLTIRFPNIMLADSTSDSEGSIGFIQYRAKPVSGLPNGTIIRNTAYIYFDYNSPIITNTSENWFSSVGLNELSDSNIKLYPNPASNAVMFESDEEMESLEFFALNGVKVKTHQSNAVKTKVDVSAFENGIYIVKIHSKSGIVNKRLVVSQ